MAFRDVVEGVLVGVAAGLVIFYGLQPKEAYPSWMLIPYDHPWMFIVILFVIGYVTMYHHVLGALLLLLVVSLYVDLIMYGKPSVYKNGTAILNGDDDAKGEDVVGVNSYSYDHTQGTPLSSVDITEPNYPMFYGLNDVQPGEPAPF